MNNMIKNKATRGKKQRKVKPIDDTTSRQVTFSKRRVSVFKKASEICVLSGAEAVILCESVGGSVFAFGHPSVEHVVDKYLGNKNSSELSENNSAATKIYMNSPCMLEELNKQYLEITKEMEIEKNISENMINKNKEESDFWWQQPFDHLEEKELEEYISSMEKLKNNLKLKANDMRLIRMSSSMFDANNSLNSNDTGSSDAYLASRNLTTKDYGLHDEFLTTNNPTKHDYGGVPDEFFTNKDLTMKGYDLPDEFFANKNPTKQDYGVLDEFFTNKDPTTKGYGMPDEFFTNKNLTKQNYGVSDEFFTDKNQTKQDYGVLDEIFANKNTTTKGYGSPDEFFTNKNLNKQDYGMSDEFFANKKLTTKGYGLPDECFANKELNSNDDGLLNELLKINDTNCNDESDAFFTDHELDAFFTDLKLPIDCGNNVHVPNIYGNTGTQVQPS
ncbi:hypothetical protein POM88_030912 [Heracleum sosnowskyi]|uniref:MADS-box domain-containing protein n=1 Tax=Heracleum sosnowskyi TaxID=360622 RepID=A0AAD8MJ86_9APIA|nr:hypothetical protein POM88_030912 [Heracleum sosnowskyi]